MTSVMQAWKDVCKENHRLEADNAALRKEMNWIRLGKEEVEESLKKANQDWDTMKKMIDDRNAEIAALRKEIERIKPQWANDRGLKNSWYHSFCDLRETLKKTDIILDEQKEVIAALNDRWETFGKEKNDEIRKLKGQLDTGCRSYDTCWLHGAPRRHLVGALRALVEELPCELVNCNESTEDDPCEHLISKRKVLAFINELSSPSGGTGGLGNIGPDYSHEQDFANTIKPKSESGGESPGLTNVCTGFKGRLKMAEWRCEKCGQYSQFGSREGTRIGDRRKCSSCSTPMPPGGEVPSELSKNGIGENQIPVSMDLGTPKPDEKCKRCGHAKHDGYCYNRRDGYACMCVNLGKGKFGKYKPYGPKPEWICAKCGHPLDEDGFHSGQVSGDKCLVVGCNCDDAIPEPKPSGRKVEG